MVVVSGSCGKNVVTFPIRASNNDMVIPTANNMSAKAVLTCRPNSHPFQERTLCLDEPVKVGRSVARARATATNAIFDCKVLSRHHALLWYEDGKFYLQDTKSSNGTFVNNNRLSSSDSEAHEVSSGDIVQFGVDVVENNRKVTHGCIIATLKLYLPDGKEAKASPSITEGNRQGFVPLDELYKLNQIIQEASQRELCLETKLTALQHVVDEARRCADDSWQAYVGEERLLSRVAALECQLVQAGKNFGDERLREELTKLQEDRATYQVAAKESLRKLIAERLEAVESAAIHQRARATAEQEAMLARDDLEKSQKEIQQIAQKLSDERKKSDEEKTQLEQRLRELEARLEVEQQNVADLENKIEQLAFNPMQDPQLREELERCNLIIENDWKLKEEMIGENDVDSEFNNCPNGIDEPQYNHINRSVAPGPEQPEVISMDSRLSDSGSQEDLSRISNDSLVTHVTWRENLVDDDENAKDCNEYDRPDMKISDDDTEVQSTSSEDEAYVEERDRRRTIDVNSKTLKYQFQTAQNELKKQIENLEQIVTANRTKILDLEENLSGERKVNIEKTEEVEQLKRELVLLEQKWKESSNEAQHLKDRVVFLQERPTEEAVDGNRTERGVSDADDISTSNLSVEQLVAVEEELVLMKERYAQVNEEKLLLNKNLHSIREQYNTLCNRSSNTVFLYVAPLVLMVLYLLISSMFS